MVELAAAALNCVAVALKIVLHFLTRPSENKPSKPDVPES